MPALEASYGRTGLTSASGRQEVPPHIGQRLEARRAETS
jgi:hypothetical protein